MRILFLGDVVGRSGRNAIIENLSAIRASQNLDFIIVNAENAASGFGCSVKIADQILDAGADVITLGDHAFDQRDIMLHLERDSRIIRPLNISKQAPGHGSYLYQLADGRSVMVATVLGRVFMKQPYDDPFSALDEVLNNCPMGTVADAIVVEIHAEATSEKMGIGHWCDGRASLVVGTHTHIPTSDTMILSKGTAYQTDAGMCGDYNSVIGMDKQEPMRRFISGISSGRMEPASGNATLSGIIVETDDATGLAIATSPFKYGGILQQV